MRRLLLPILVGAALLAACTSGSGTSSSSSPSTSAPPSTGVTSLPGEGGTLPGGSGETSSSSSPSSPPSSTTASRSAPSSTAPVTQLPGPCPYISAEDARAAEGDRVGEVYRLSGDPAGCRFYFEYDPSQIVLEITFRRETNEDFGLRYLISLTKNHPEYVTDKDIGAGAVSIKTDLQGTATWQCSFVKGNYVVTVHTREPNPSYDARKLARLIEPKVP